MASESKPGKIERAGGRAAPKRGSHRRGGLGELFGMDSERQARFLLIGITAVVIAAAVAFIGIGYYMSVVKPRHRTVLQADDYKVSYTAMKRRMAYEYFQSATFQSQAQVLPEATYLNLLNELTLLSRADSELGVTASDDEIDKQLRARVGVAPDADAKTFADRYKIALDTSGLHADEYRRLVEAQVLEQKIRDKFNTEAPATIIQAKVEVMAVADETKAKAAIARVNAGEDWAAVAKSVSSESDVQTTGGVHDYAPQGSFNIAYDDYAFDANLGQVSDPLSGAGGTFYVVRVIDRADRDLTDAQKPSYVTRKYGDWLTQTQAKMKIERHWELPAQRDALFAVLKNATQNQQVPDRQVPVNPQPVAPDSGNPGAPAPDTNPPPAAPDSNAPAPPDNPPPANGQ